MFVAINKLLQNIEECYEEAKHVVPPNVLKTKLDSKKRYTKDDYDNIILKKERLILQRNAELFPKGSSKKALDLYDTYESVKSKTVRLKLNLRT